MGGTERWLAAAVLGVSLLGCRGHFPNPGGEPIGGNIPSADGGTLLPDGGSSSPDGGLPPEVDGGVAEPSAPGGGDWPQYRHDIAGTVDNPGEFTTQEAGDLREIWVDELGAYGYTQPMVVGDTVYVTTGFSGKVVALDAHTGAVHWTRELNHTFQTACDPEVAHPGFFAAPAVVDGVVYAASPDGNLYALDATTGATRWQSPVASPDRHSEFVQSSPAVSTQLGKVFLGVASTFGCDPVEGRVLAVDLSTGAAQSHALVPPGVPGTPVWSSISVDEEAGRIYASTGDSADHPLSQEPLAQSIVALDAHTLDVLDHWQNPGPPPAEDSDFGASPTLFQSADGTPLVAAANKDGWLYVLRRDQLSSGPVWKLQLAVPGNPTDGEGSLVTPTFANGILYAAGGRTPSGEPGSVVALDPGTGNVLWRHVPPGYVIAAMPAVGDILVVESTAPGNATSALEILDAHTGATLKHFDGQSGTFGAPTVAHGLILWSEFSGRLHAIAAPAYWK